MNTILITGASSGLGAALARTYAKPGIKLYITGRNKERLNSISNQCQQLGATVQEKVIDVTNHNDLQQWVLDINKENPIDIVIANAGIYTHSALGEIETLFSICDVINTNTLGAIATANPLIHTMRTRNQGNIVFISSLFSLVSFPHSPIYSASKAALNAYADGLRMNLINTNVKVTVVYAGLIASAITDKVPGVKPFMISAEKAAIIIKNGIKKNNRRIFFPRTFYFLILLTKYLPQNILYLMFKWVSMKKF